MAPSTLGLAMIARDEERCIARALDSVAPYVNEMVVVDTGSTDRTVEIATSCGAAVKHFEWVDDFAAAKNHALEQLSTDYILVLDADEWISEGEGLSAWLASRSGHGVAGLVPVVSTTTSEGTEIEEVSWLTRVIPQGLRFEGRIHEAPVGYRAATRISGVRVEHDGYEAAQVAKKRGRNLRLLERELTLTPNDAFTHYQYAKEKQILEDHATAADHYQRALALLEDAKDPSRPVWRSDLVSRLMFVLSQEGRFPSAVSVLNHETSIGGATTGVLLAAGNLFLNMAISRPNEAERFVALARAAWLKCLNVSLAADGPGDGSSGTGGQLAAHNLAVLAAGQGKFDEQRHWEGVVAALTPATRTGSLPASSLRA